jgi:hypothetical protein
MIAKDCSANYQARIAANIAKLPELIRRSASD